MDACLTFLMWAIILTIIPTDVEGACLEFWHEFSTKNARMKSTLKTLMECLTFCLENESCSSATWWDSTGCFVKTGRYSDRDRTIRVKSDHYKKYTKCVIADTDCFTDYPRKTYRNKIFNLDRTVYKANTEADCRMACRMTINCQAVEWKQKKISCYMWDKPVVIKKLRRSRDILFISKRPHCNDPKESEGMDQKVTTVTTVTPVAPTSPQSCSAESRDSGEVRKELHQTLYQRTDDSYHDVMSRKNVMTCVTCFPSVSVIQCSFSCTLVTSCSRFSFYVRNNTCCTGL